MTQAAPRLIDPVEIRRAYELLFEPGQVVELRALHATTRQTYHHKRYTVSGYFTSADSLVKAASEIIAATGIYITLNPCRRGLITRAYNRLRSFEDMGVDDRTTKDNEILHYRWLPVDIDPVRQDCNDSSSDREHEAALTLAYHIRETLQAENWPDSILADSGNGAHILYRMDLENDEAGIKKLRNALAYLHERFSTDAAKVDTIIYNPARIMKLYGTLACKGDSTPEWPHRMSRILEVLS